jgi:acetolactate synthase-1/2/3 large subunit
MGEILVKALQAEGVSIWLPGPGCVLYDALYKQCSSACAGAPRAAGAAGDCPCDRRSGRGAGDSAPADQCGAGTPPPAAILWVVISGQTSTNYIGTDAFQECDTVGITRPVVKHNFLVKDVRDLAATMKKAFHIARTGRPGPWWWTSPDVSFKKATYTGYPQSVEMRLHPVKKGHAGQIRKALQLLLTRQAPYIYRRRRAAGQCLQRAAQLVDLLGYPSPTR